MKKTVVIGGGTGLVGKRLAELLAARGDEVRILTRSPQRVRKYKGFAWDAKAMTIDEAALEGATHVINLAGAGIADARWSDKRKALIIDSRTGTTQLLSDAICRNGLTVEAFISASAIGYYGNSGEEWVTESSSPGKGFLSQSTLAWEAAVEALRAATQRRTCYLRTGIALSPNGGALEKMLLTARLGVSGYFGDGSQYYSWIHLDDLCNIYISALDDERFEGALNACAPQPVRNKRLAQALASAVRNPALSLPVPAFGLKLVFGEMSHTILDSCRVSSEKLINELGFTFKHADLDEALRALLGTA